MADNRLQIHDLLNAMDASAFLDVAFSKSKQKSMSFVDALTDAIDQAKSYATELKADGHTVNVFAAVQVGSCWAVMNEQREAFSQQPNQQED